MNKSEAREFLKSLKELKGYELYGVNVEIDGSLSFNCCKGNKCYYGYYENGEIALDFAGKRSDLE